MRRKFLAFLFGWGLCTAVWALDLNQASEAELDSFKGLGPATTAKILAARAQGTFKDWPDFVRRVPGVGVVKAQQLSAQGATIAQQAAPKKF